MPVNGSVLALDIGTVRVGVAVARLDVRIARPLETFAYNAATINEIVAKLVREQGIVAVVAGWPRGLEGQATSQTQFAESVVAQLREVLPVPVYLQDEALSSTRAEAELTRRQKPYSKADVDALAAALILEDYLQNVEDKHQVSQEHV